MRCNILICCVRCPPHDYQEGCDSALLALLESSVIPSIKSHEYIALAIGAFAHLIDVQIKHTTPTFMCNLDMLMQIFKYGDERLAKKHSLAARVILLQLQMRAKNGTPAHDHVVAVIWPAGSLVGHIADAFCDTPCKLTPEGMDYCANGTCTGVATAREVTIRQVCIPPWITPAT